MDSGEEDIRLTLAHELGEIREAILTDAPKCRVSSLDQAAAVNEPLNGMMPSACVTADVGGAGQV